MYCEKCGTKIEGGKNFCPGCGANLNLPKENKSDNDYDQKTAKGLAIGSTAALLCSMGFLALIPILNNSKFLPSSGGFYIIGLIVTIVLRVKFPKYKPGKVLIWLYIRCDLKRFRQD